MGVAVGIDLGTTNSAIAWIDEYGRPVIIPNQLGEPTTPSVICFNGDDVVVGREAKELQAAGEPNVAAFFKRQMGVPHFAFYIDGREYTAVDLSAIVLKTLKADAEAALGQEITDAVITVPAYFRNPQREATIAAAQQAGLNVLQVINEPTAAAKAYGIRSAGSDKTMLIYDLGGGTFDVTLLRITETELRILTSEGNFELGGKNWDDRLVEHVGAEFQSQHGVDPFEDSETVGDLLVRAEDTKKRLSSSESATFSLTHAGVRAKFDVTRGTFDQLTRDLMEQTRSLCTKVLEQHRILPKDLDGVLLVGGSTRMSMVHDFVKDYFSQSPLQGVNVDEAVALGAALEAAERVADTDDSSKPALSLAGRTTIDVTNHSLGMIGVNDDESAYINTIILSKDLTIPCEHSRPYRVRCPRGGVGRVEILMTQGETESPADVSYLGKYSVENIPGGSDGLALLDIEYSYTRSGTVDVSARAHADGSSLPVVIDDLPADVPARFLQPPPQGGAGGPMSVYLVFDLSGSMSGDPLEKAQKAAKNDFMSNVDLANCSVGIMTVADEVGINQKACKNAKDINRAIDSLSIGEVGIGNRAHPFDDIAQAFKNTKGEKYAVVLADGVWGNQPLAIERARACHAAGIEVVAVGFGSADRDFLNAIASSDEASFFVNLGDLGQQFSSIAQAITGSGGMMMLGAHEKGEGKSKWSLLRGRR